MFGTAWWVGPLSFLLAAVGCAGAGAFTNVEELPDAGAAVSEYRIGRRDVLGVRVWNQEAISADRAQVRDDGKISVTFLGDVLAEGKTPPQLAKEIEQALLPFIVKPLVTITVEEMAPLSVSVLGEVRMPGAYTLARGSGVLQGIAAGGGLTDYADEDSIFVIRGDGAQVQRIRFRFSALKRGEPRAAGFRLKSGDVVVAE